MTSLWGRYTALFVLAPPPTARHVLRRYGLALRHGDGIPATQSPVRTRNPGSDHSSRSTSLGAPRPRTGRDGHPRRLHEGMTTRLERPLGARYCHVHRRRTRERDASASRSTYLLPPPSQSTELRSFTRAMHGRAGKVPERVASRGGGVGSPAGHRRSPIRPACRNLLDANMTVDMATRRKEILIDEARDSSRRCFVWGPGHAAGLADPCSSVLQ